jgi:hypothetical protein
LFGGFVAALIAIPTAGAIQVIVGEIWRATAPGALQDRADPGSVTPP